MSYKYMLLDSRGAPVAQGVSEDGPEKNVWQLRIAHGDIKRVLGLWLEYLIKLMKT